MKNLKFFLILNFFISLSSQQDFLSYERNLRSSTENLIKCEQNIDKKLSDFSAYVRVSMKNLEAVNIAFNLTEIFKSTLDTITELRTIKSYESFFEVSNYSTCDYRNIRASFLDLSMRKFHFQISQVEKNLTKICDKFNEISFNYVTNLRTLMKFWTRERSVVNIFRQFPLMLNEYWKYVGILKNSLFNFGNFHTFLSQINGCSETKSRFSDEGSKIENVLRDCEG